MNQIFALDANYEKAAEQLLALHRRLPGKPAILRRLVAVYEQMRDTGKAAACHLIPMSAIQLSGWDSYQRVLS